MGRTGGWIVLASLMASAVLGAGAADSRKIVVAKSFGAVTAKTTRAEVAAIYGTANVRDAEIRGPEGTTFPGTVVYGKKPADRFEIIWVDPKTKRKPEIVRVGRAKTRWQTTHGITIGTSLKEIEKLNGKPLTLNGFGWDLGGGVISWNGGKLAKECYGKLLLTFDAIGEEKLTPKEASKVMGEQEVRSNSSVMRKLDIRVEELALALR
jgi:hypothetical protein